MSVRNQKYPASLLKSMILILIDNYHIHISTTGFEQLSVIIKPYTKSTLNTE